MGDDAQRVNEDRRQLDEAMALAELAVELTTARKTVADTSLELCHVTLNQLNIDPGAAGEYRKACAEVLGRARAVEMAAATLRRLGDKLRVAADQESVAKALALATKSREGIEIHLRRSLEKEMAVAEREAELTSARKALVDARDALSNASNRRSKVDPGQPADYRNACTEVLKLARAVDNAAVKVRQLGGQRPNTPERVAVSQALALVAKCRGQIEILVRLRFWWSRASG